LQEGHATFNELSLVAAQQSVREKDQELHCKRRSFPSSSRQTSRAAARASTLPTAADSNGDSNSSNQRQASAVSSTHGHRMLCGDLAICPAWKTDGRSARHPTEHLAYALRKFDLTENNISQSSHSFETGSLRDPEQCYLKQCGQHDPEDDPVII
jgi:hypothetical protein